MAVEHARVLVVEDRGLDAPAEQRPRLAHEVLVERVLAGDEHRQPVPAPARAAPLLPQRGDRAGEADRDHAVEQADVDPELERVRRADAEQLALEQPPLDLAPLLRRVAGAVGREPRVVAEPVGGEAVDQLGRAAALGEAERPQAALDQVGHQLRRLAERRGAQAELLVGQRRVPERDRPLGARRGVVADHGRLDAEQPRRQLARVGDRGRGEQELRVGAVDPREPPQPPQHVGDVRAEDAAVDVRLVDDHVGEVREHVAPAVVVREHAHVEHVRVGEDQVRPLAHLPAPVGGGVAVVDRGPQLGQAERPERPQLVLRERLRRVEVERPLLRLARERVQHGQVEGERLPGGGAGRDDEVLAARGRLPGLGLVRVERVHALRRERLAHARVQRLGQRREDRVSRRHLLEMGELLALEQAGPARGDAHRRARRATRYG